MLAVIGSSVITGGIAALASLFHKAPGTASNVGPCGSPSGPSGPAVFALPLAAQGGPNGVCASSDVEATRSYQLALFSPVGNPMVDAASGATGPSVLLSTDKNTADVTPTATATDFPAFTQLKDLVAGQPVPITLMPSKAVTVAAPIQDNVNLFTASGGSAEPSSDTVYNFCPQTFVFESDFDAGLKQSNFTSAVPLPVSIVSRVADPTTTDPKIWVFAGLADTAAGTNGLNVPVNIDATKRFLAASANGGSSAPNGLATTLYVYAIKPVVIYLELGGASGGSVDVYSGGIDPKTKKPVKLDPGYVGGAPGVVYGLYPLAAGDTLKVCLGSLGDTNLSLPAPFDGNGQGGIGTMFGGANGGGASYAVHYAASSYGGPNASKEAFAAALADQNGTLVCVAGGGGGASRNASGGHAGFCETTVGPSGPIAAYGSLGYGSAVTSSAFGSPGGATNVLGLAPVAPSHLLNGFSGGGGVVTTGGQSNVPNPAQGDRSCWGHKLQPFVQSGANGGHGGGSVITDTGSGGGGGGGGLFGGGAGGYNGVAKPNNLHGAGGGGSSWFGLLKPGTTPLPVKLSDGSEPQSVGRSSSLNMYRDAAKTGAAWPPGSGYGYMVIGLSSSSDE